jgi:hypothetical protein
MSYADKRKQRIEENANVSRHDFDWEEKQVPLLHSGFLEPCERNAEKSTLQVTFWFQGGSYRCRIQDRSSDEKAFLDVGTLCDAFANLETALRENLLDWSPDKFSRNGR